MANPFDQFDPPPAAPAQAGGNPFDQFDAPAQPNAAADAAKSTGIGLLEGGMKMAGTPADLLQTGLKYGFDIGNKIRVAIGKEPYPQSERDVLNQPMPGTYEFNKSQAEKVTGPFYESQTTLGKYAKTIGEFGFSAPMIEGGLVAKGAQTVIPAVTSEAAGQWADKNVPSLAPWIRTGTAILSSLATGGAQAVVSRPSNAAEAVATRIKGASPEQLQQAETLFQSANQAGIPLSRANALDYVTQGATRLSDAQRVLEGTGRMGEFYAPAAEGAENAGRSVLNAVAPPNNAPTKLGFELQDAARQGVAATPEGQALSQRVWEAGPRTTPEQAGQVIQPELAKVQEGRVGMRKALADADYEAARNAPATVPLDGGFGFRDVTHHYDGPDIPILLNPADREAARVSQQAERNVTERMPVVGLEPTQFGQVDAQPVVSAIDKMLETAKGAPAQALAAAKKALFKPNGELDNSIEGLNASRTAINDLISQASRAGADNTARQLEEGLAQLDSVLEQVPAYGQARRNFKAASEPLAPFGESKAPGQIVQRDQYNKEFTLPPEQAPSAIDKAGPSGARDFNAVASPEARQAYEGHLTTRFLDGATDAGGNISADRLRIAMRDNEDVLNQFPAVRERLENVAMARDGLARVEASPLGKIAERPEVKAAIEALFPQKPIANSAEEVGAAMSALAQRSPAAARDLLRIHMETLFNQATKRLQGGDNQAGLAKFAAMLRGNAGQRESLEAAFRAIPGGEDTLAGVNRFLEIAEATGTRQRVGSGTSFNNEFLTDMQKGNPLGTAGALAVGGGFKWPQKVMDTMDRWRLGKNMDELTRLFTDPRAAGAFQALSKAAPGSNQAKALTARLSLLAASKAAGQ